MKKTMEMLENEFYYMDMFDLWNELATHNELLGCTDRELCEVFEELYAVDAVEVFEYFCCED
jgi:hypothetical protein